MPAEGRKRSMVIVHRQQRHTFSAYNPRKLPDACSSVSISVLLMQSLETFVTPTLI